MEEVLTELESLLRRHGFVGQARTVAQALVAYRSGDRSAFAHEATGLSMWGGAGSVADSDFRGNSPQLPEEAAADVPRYYRAMIGLAEALERERLALLESGTSPRPFAVGSRRLSNVRCS